MAGESSDSGRAIETRHEVPGTALGCSTGSERSTSATGSTQSSGDSIFALMPACSRITSGPNPGAVTGTSVSFTFDTNATGMATFECARDKGAYQPCTSPKAYTGLSAESHTFRVRSVVTGGVDASPATRTWTVQRK
jgi:hypothetical protein